MMKALATHCAIWGLAGILFAASQERRWNFDDDRVGSLPAGWTVARTLSEQPGSDWIVRQDDKDTSNHILSQISSAGADHQYNLCVSDAAYQNLQLAISVRARQGKTDQGGGVVWRYCDAQNYYVCRWNPLENSLRVYKVVHGVRSQLDSAKVPTGTSHWRRLKIVQFGRDMRGYLDGQLLLDVEDDQFPDAGRIGLWSKADAVTDFDRLFAKEASAEDLEEISARE
jgi:hypothetical protein